MLSWRQRQEKRYSKRYGVSDTDDVSTYFSEKNMAIKQKGGHGGGGHDGAGGLRWLLTYADMITLVMAFFIMLYAMSRVDLVRFEKTAFAIRAGFGQAKATDSSRVMTGGGSTDFPPRYRVVEKNELIKNAMRRSDEQVGAGGGAQDINNDEAKAADDQVAKGMSKQEAAKLSKVGQTIKQRLGQRGLAKNVDILVDERGLVVRIKSDNILFELGKADLKKDSVPLLNTLAATLKSVPNVVRVEGHTDILPISTLRYPSNWELSTARASSVIRYWLATGALSPSRLSAAGYADSRPVASNATGYGRALNRRVEVVVVWKGP